jgi:hypothetical protein
MRVQYDGRVYEFRACDTAGVNQGQLQDLVDRCGHLQYEPRAVWLVVCGIYGWEVQE